MPDEPARSTISSSPLIVSRQRDLHRVFARAIAVEIAFPVPGAVLDRGDRFAVHASRLLEDVVASRPVGLDADAVQQLREPALAGADGGDLGVQVADARVRHAGVEPQQVEPLADGLAPGHDAGWPEAQPLLVDVRGAHDRAGVDGADVVPVRARGAEADQLAAEEDRPDHRHVMQVRSLHVAVVHNEDIARGDVVAVIVDHMMDIGIDGTDEERHAARFGPACCRRRPAARRRCPGPRRSPPNGRSARARRSYPPRRRRRSCARSPSSRGPRCCAPSCRS